jgi:hypothetical protein
VNTYHMIEVIACPIACSVAIQAPRVFDTLISKRLAKELGLLGARNVPARLRHYYTWIGSMALALACATSFAWGSNALSDLAAVPTLCGFVTLAVLSIQERGILGDHHAPGGRDAFGLRGSKPNTPN